MLVILAIAALAILACVVLVSLGRGGELTEFPPDVPPLNLPEAGKLTAVDFMALRLPVNLVGYHTQSVDETLRRAANAISARDTRIAVLEQRVSELLSSRLHARQEVYAAPGAGLRTDHEPPAAPHTLPDPDPTPSPATVTASEEPAPGEGAAAGEAVSASPAEPPVPGEAAVPEETASTGEDVAHDAEPPAPAEPSASGEAASASVEPAASDEAADEVAVPGEGATASGEVTYVDGVDGAERAGGGPAQNGEGETVRVARDGDERA
ncbi:hypothetical protein ACBI99_29040 [Nonomuraea sp. ATR24]|uniref:hypothetical protein n=1 Tax=Nonomuraea sp. ATR24 TaxID=1676744 RepID=UPI0035C05999